MYIVYLIAVAIWQPKKLPALPAHELGPIQWGKLVNALLPPLLLSGAVLGSILGGYATPTAAEARGESVARVMARVKRWLGFAHVREQIGRRSGREGMGVVLV